MNQWGRLGSFLSGKVGSAKPTIQEEELVAASASKSRYYANPFPLKPYVPERKTVVRKIDEDIFSFEQEHGFANVSVNIRMTVIRMEDGGLWVHAPIAPTDECVAMVKRLGEVKYIVLPTTGLEHKLFMAPFVRKFPGAQNFVAPGQWSWPVDLPLGFRVDGILQDNDSTTPWAKEIEQKVVSVPVGIGTCSEAAFFHKKSKTLLVTDAVIFIPPDAPEVVAAMRAEENKWQKSALMACFLGPPYVPSFEAIAGKVFVSPVVRTFIYERSVDEHLAWVRDIAAWNFNRIVPAHLDAPISAGPKDFLRAFDFLVNPDQNPLPAGDMRPLNAISKLLTISGLVPPRAADSV